MSPAAEQQEQQQPDQPAQVDQRTVTLRKPVGVVFAQNKGGPVFVEELTAGGNADKSGAVQVREGAASSECSRRGATQQDPIGGGLAVTPRLCRHSREGCMLCLFLAPRRASAEERCE